MKKLLIILASVLGLGGVVAGLYFGYQIAGNKIYNYANNGDSLIFCEDSTVDLNDRGFIPVRPRFESSDEGVFSVDDKGIITTKDCGSATLTVTGFNFEYTSPVTVKPHEGDLVDCDIRFLCKNCNNKVLVKGGHQLTELTCEEDSVCTRCGYVNETHKGHKYNKADCENPETCNKCGATNGEPLGHKWIGGTCTRPPVCEVCSKKGDKPAGHSFSEATCTEDSKCIWCDTPGTAKATGHIMVDADCTEPKHCINCDYKEGNSLGHKAGKADCQTANYCTRCGEKISEAGQHVFANATCTKPKTCKVCKKTEGSALGHTRVEATCTKGAYCSVCNTTLSNPIDHLYVTAESGSVICAYCGRSKSSNSRYNYSSSSDVSGFADEVVRLVNIERAANGLGALSMDSLLRQAADVRAVEVYGYFSHTRPNGSSCFTAMDEAGYSYWTAGENIAKGHTSPEMVVDAWMNSSGHRANILNSSFTRIGVGVYSSGGVISWVQMFSD